MYVYIFGNERFRDDSEYTQACVILAARDDDSALLALEIELVSADIPFDSFVRDATMVRLPVNPFGVKIVGAGCTLATVNIHLGDARTSSFSDPPIKRASDQRIESRVLPTIFAADALDVLSLTETHTHWRHLKRDV